MVHNTTIEKTVDIPSASIKGNTAGKDVAQFRDYAGSSRAEIVRETYRLMHINQTVENVKKMREKWLSFSHGEYTIWEIIELLDTFRDDSDPDTDIPNSFHDFQTAERIREAHPSLDWFHLTGFLHDLGKVLALWGEPQWAVVGDTYPVGCAYSDKIVHADSLALCSDATHDIYRSVNGLYTPHCGLDAVLMSWGHDEYMYQVIKKNGGTIPEIGLRMIRYHSFYPWHTGKAYSLLLNATDEEALPWVLEFNKFDLYSKSDALPNQDDLKPYYQSLLVKYGLDGKLKW